MYKFTFIYVCKIYTSVPMEICLLVYYGTLNASLERFTYISMPEFKHKILTGMYRIT